MNMLINKVLLMAVVTALVDTSTAFLWRDPTCYRPSPSCHCSVTETLFCGNSSLTQIPPLRSPRYYDTPATVTIYLYENQITTIPAHAFDYLQKEYTYTGGDKTRYYIDLDNNSISSVDPNAFTGLENSLHGLVLSHNQLTSVPSAALENLTALESLALADNPLTSIDFSSMARFSWSLTEFGIDMRNVHTWPADLNKLQNLTRLTIEHIPLAHLPLNAFAGFETSLQELRLSNSKLAGVPTAVCRLPNLYSFQFVNNGALDSNFSTEDPCSEKKTAMLTWYLSNSSLDTFPNTLPTFPSLQNFVLDDNNISVIDPDRIPSDHRLQSLFIRNNHLARIPLAINKFKHLTNLSLDGNQITSIEDNDLSGLTQLTLLQLNDNPIEYISPQAFNSNTMIGALLLTNTMLQLVPSAVLSLPQLYQLKLPDNTIDCTCKLSYMKGWNVSLLHDTFGLQGDCRHQHTKWNDGIRQFLVSSLSVCS